VNLRQNTTDQVKGYNADILRESCELATVVKCNSGELEEMCDMLGLARVTPAVSTSATGTVQQLEASMEQLRSRYSLDVVVVTRGAQGALLRSSTDTIRLQDSTLPLDAIHPVGAGDAFSAGLLYGLTQGCSLHDSALLADCLASWVTGYASATPTLTPQILAKLRALEPCTGL
jgi:sugar/nucleoside kinase (ribokinase family)